MADSPYNPVSTEIITILEDVCGSKNVVLDEKKLKRYSRDQTAESKYAHMPEAVVFPGNSEEVASIIKTALKYKIPVTPRGAGSGLSGGCVPVFGGIVICLERLNRIMDIDRDNMFLVTEPGVVTRNLDPPLSEQGLFFAGYPMSEEFCHVGGNIAENAGGGRAIKYGVTGRYIHGLDIVTPAGDIISLGGKRVKDVTGYDLLRLMVGSEGTLGIFTRAIIRLTPRPTYRRTILTLFPDAEKAIRVIPRIMIAGGVIPTSIEFIDRICLHRTCEFLKETIPYQKAGAMMLFETDGNRESIVQEEAERIGEICSGNGALKVLPAKSLEESERFWKIRKSVTWALKKFSPRQSLEDIVVPPAAIPEILKKLERISAKYDTPIPCYGHAGDGNLHATPLKNPEHTDEQWEKSLPLVLKEIYHETSRLGGAISGEHGIGHKRKPYLPIVMSNSHLKMMRSVKKSLDPGNIMNPGKII